MSTFIKSIDFATTTVAASSAMEGGTQHHLSQSNLLPPHSSVCDDMDPEDQGFRPIKRTDPYKAFAKKIKLSEKVEKNADGVVVRKITKYILCKVPPEVIRRRQTWKPFGITTNKNVTTRSTEDIYMTIIDRDDKYNLKKEKAEREKAQASASASKQKYVPKRMKLKELAPADGGSDAGFSSSAGGSPFGGNSYVPPSIRKKLKQNKNKEHISIVVKNIPITLDKYEAKDRLRSLLSKFGEIQKINVLMDKYDNTKIRDIAFVDFVYPSDAEAALQSTERLIIDSCILTKDRAKKQ